MTLENAGDLLRGSFFARLASISNFDFFKIKEIINSILKKLNLRPVSAGDILEIVFTPSKPVTIAKLFRGRITQIESLFGMLRQDGKHCVLYGERGVGKTSIANFFKYSLKENVICSRITCNTNETYKSMWEKIFEEAWISRDDLDSSSKIKIPNVRNSEGKVKLSNILPENLKFNANGITNFLQSIKRDFVIIIDEFDRVRDDFNKAIFADTIKTISDNNFNIKFVIVGVAKNVNELVGQHESISRNLKQIHLPLMKEAEIREILEEGFRCLDISIDSTILNKMTSYCCGYPYYAHTLAYNSMLSVISNNQNSLNEDNLKDAIKNSISESEETLRNMYEKATLSAQKSIFPQILWACASVEADEHGYFQAKDLIKPLSNILGENILSTNKFNYHLKKLALKEKGEILVHGDEKKRKYKFREALLKPFLLMKKDIKN